VAGTPAMLSQRCGFSAKTVAKCSYPLLDAALMALFWHVYGFCALHHFEFAPF
jgi:hypothetical protein